jgi:arginine decarboxylase
MKANDITAVEPSNEADAAWTIADSAALYRVEDWSDRFFHINEQGHAAVRTARTQADSSSDSIDINTVVQDLRNRGVQMPCLLRFHDVLRARVERVNLAFSQAIDESGYAGSYRGVYPIKVNQMHEVVDEILDAGRPFRMGLECGSKPELVAALPHITDDEILLICNGVKDESMLGLILAAQRLGRNVIPVMEKFTEATRLLELAKARGAKPWLGVRVRLDTSGSGKWAESGSHLSKFGLSIPELVDLVTLLRERDMLDSLTMLHFHIGSQIADVQVVRQAVREITRVYAQLCERGASPRYLDVGGGLGVNYAAGYSDSEDDNGINYSLQEYANAVVYGVKEVCDATSSPCPILVSESGRAMVAHHSLLVVDVLGAYRKDRVQGDFRPSVEDHALVHALYAALSWIRGMPLEDAKVTNLLEAYHDAAEAKAQADTLFNLGYLEIEDKARTERLFWSVCDELHARAGSDSSNVPAELLALNEQLVDQYLCNFSVFQSILDHWAIDQRFPIMPIARLDERPDRRAILVDLTCDSDGKVEHYVSSEENKGCLPVHSLRDGEAYHVALFLMGAYQDIMGDTHNLFGPVSEAHVYADAEEPGGYYIEKVIRGITIKEMLGRVQYFPNDLNRRMSEIIRAKTAAGVLRPRAGVDLLEQYGALFDSGTYLDPDDKDKR